MSAASDWVAFDPLTLTYMTKDGAAVAAELVDNCECLAEAIWIAEIRDRQRKAMKPATAGSGQEAGTT